MGEARRRAAWTWVATVAAVSFAPLASAHEPPPPAAGGGSVPAVPSDPAPPLAPATAQAPAPSYAPAPPATPCVPATVPTPYFTDRTCCPKGGVSVYGEDKRPADLSGDRGTIEAWVARAEFEVAIPLSRSTTWEVLGAAQRDTYHLSDPDAIVPGTGRILEEATLLSLTTRYELAMSRALAVRVGVNATSQGVPGAEFEDTLTWGVEGSFKVAVGADTWIRLGLAYHTVLEESGSLWPVVDVGGGIGEGSPWEVEWRWNYLGVSREVLPCLRLGVAGRYDREDWRLAESDRVPGGVARDIRYSVGAFATRVITDHARISAVAWYDFGHDFLIDDEDGDRVTDLPADPSLSFGVWFSWTF